MYPRSEMDRQKGLLSGFVAFTTRKDAEIAMKTMDGKINKKLKFLHK